MKINIDEVNLGISDLSFMIGRVTREDKSTKGNYEALAFISS